MNQDGWISVTPLRADLTAHDAARPAAGAAGMTTQERRGRAQDAVPVRAALARGDRQARARRRWSGSTAAPSSPGLFADRAYEDMPLPIACGQTISQPSVVGLMTQALDVQPRAQGARDRHRLGLPGGDPGAACAAGLHGRPASPAGAARRTALFEELGITNITAITADGSRGCPSRRRSTASSSPPRPRTRRARSWRSCAWAVSWCCRWGSRTRCKG